MKKQMLFLSFSIFMTAADALPAAPKNDPSLNPLALKLEIERLQARMEHDKIYGHYKLGLSQLAHPSEYLVDARNLSPHAVSNWCNFHLIGPYKDVNERTDAMRSRLENMPSWFEQKTIEHFIDGIKENTNQSIGLLEDYKNFILAPHTSKETDAKIQSLQEKLSHNNKLINQKIVAIERNFWDQTCNRIAPSN